VPSARGSEWIRRWKLAKSAFATPSRTRRQSPYGVSNTGPSASGKRVPRRMHSRRAGRGPRELLKPCSQSASARDRAYGISSRGFTRPGRSPRLEPSEAGGRSAVPTRRMNSRLRQRDFRLRGPLVQRAGDVPRRLASRARRAWPTRASDALFAERVSARQGLWHFQPRVYPPRPVAQVGAVRSGRALCRPHPAKEFAAPTTRCPPARTARATGGRCASATGFPGAPGVAHASF
jgi:hypothetical protein